MDRKEFFEVAFKKVLGKGIQLLEKTKIAKKLEEISKENSVLKQRPPGAMPYERDFQVTCTGCDMCMAACPVNVIVIEDLDKRDPLIYPETAPCIKCPGYPCIDACPTGALHKDHGTHIKLINPQ